MTRELAAGAEQILLHAVIVAEVQRLADAHLKIFARPLKLSAPAFAGLFVLGDAFAEFLGIEICLEIYLLKGNQRYLNIALDIVEFWNSIKLPNGLFPAYKGASYSFIDDQIDMIVLLVKISNLLDSDKYFKVYNITF